MTLFSSSPSIYTPGPRASVSFAFAWRRKSRGYRRSKDSELAARRGSPCDEKALDPRMHSSAFRIYCYLSIKLELRC